MAELWHQIHAALQKGKDVSSMIRVQHGSFKRISAGLLLMWCEWVESSDEDDVTEALSSIGGILEILYPNRGTLQSTSVKWRKCIGDRFGYDTGVYKISIEKLGLPREEAIAKSAAYMAEMRSRVKKRVKQLSQQQVYEVIQSCAGSYEYSYNTVAVMLATGSRMVEVLKISEYSRAESEDQITIKGLAKSHVEHVIVRPLLFLKADKVLELVADIRAAKDFNSMTADQVNNSSAAAINRVMSKMFDSSTLEMTSHKCRYIWASIAWQLHGGEVGQQEWVRSMFGHESADTTIAYLHYHVKLTPHLEVFPELSDLPFRKEYGNRTSLRLPEAEKLRRLLLLEEALGKKLSAYRAQKYGYGAGIYRKYADLSISSTKKNNMKSSTAT